MEVNQAAESMWCPCGEIVMSFLTNFRCAMEVCWRGGWVEVGGGLSGPAQNCLFPFFPSLSLPSKLPSCSLPFHSLSFFLFPPCQSPSLKTLLCQFSPPNMLLVLLFYRPSSPFFLPLSTHLLCPSPPSFSSSIPHTLS